jgi:putative phage-type endonuclease
MDQGSDEWLQARLGNATASRIAAVTAKAKSGGWYATRDNYMAELVVERLTGVPYPSYVSQSMQWGIDTEPEARAQYEFLAEVDVVLVGFVDHPTIAMSGASPDGLVGFDGLVEIKCPDTATHIRTLDGAAIDAAYITQMQWQMACTGRQWCDWVSYDPRMPDYARIFIKRIHRDNSQIHDLEQAVEVFLREVQDKSARIRALEGK